MLCLHNKDIYEEDGAVYPFMAWAEHLEIDGKKFVAEYPVRVKVIDHMRHWLKCELPDGRIAHTKAGYVSRKKRYMRLQLEYWKYLKGFKNA